MVKLKPMVQRRMETGKFKILKNEQDLDMFNLIFFKFLFIGKAWFILILSEGPVKLKSNLTAVVQSGSFPQGPTVSMALTLNHKRIKAQTWCISH